MYENLKKKWLLRVMRNEGRKDMLEETGPLLEEMKIETGEEKIMQELKHN